MDQNFYSGSFRTALIDVSRQKSSMHRTEALPEDESCILQFLRWVSTQIEPGVPGCHLVEWNAELYPGVPAQMLVRKEKELLMLFKRPIEKWHSIGRCADHPAVTAAESLDVCRRIHIGNWDD